MKKKVLFVDDDPNIITGLRRMLRNMSAEWEMSFVNSGFEALQILENAPFDVVVSDMRMPGINGAELLNIIMEKYPQTVRMILSGHSNYEMIFQAIKPTHQFISKPCNSEDLINSISNILKRIETLKDERLKKLVLGVNCLFCNPDLYQQIVEEFKNSNPSLKKIDDLISGDIAMVITVLKLVNSSFFSSVGKVTNLQQAISMLGLDILKEVFMNREVVSPLPKGSSNSSCLDSLNQHSLILSNLAKEIFRNEVRNDQIKEGDVLTAGLLHDIGLLILFHCPEVCDSILQYASEKKCNFDEAEEQILNISHAELGASLLTLWGIPDSIVRAIFYHHQPSKADSSEFDILTPIYIAETLLAGPEPTQAANHLDYAYLNRLKLNTPLSDWLNLVTKGGRV